MSKVDLKIQYTAPDGAKGTTTISNVNPQASNQDLLDFAAMLSGLTANTYQSTNKVVTTSLDSEEVQNNV